MSKQCCICNKPFDGLGNNARPIMLGTCCDKCNASYVVPARLYFARKDSIRKAADALAKTQIHKHADVVLNGYVGKYVAITMFDGSVEVGILHVDTVAVRFMTYADGDNKEIIGYYIERENELHFRKSHVKHIAILEDNKQ